MPLRSPKRVYSPVALEHWFALLSDPWEHYFKASELDRGRDLYRSGEIRQLDLDETSLIVHMRQGKTDVYTVVEWGKKGPLIRSGISDKAEGRALAAAGLYETEELLSFELPPVPDESYSNGAEQAVMTPEPVESKPEEPREKPHLRVRLTPVPQGVRLQGFWVKNLREEPALGSLRGKGQATEAEREMLIRLTSRAKKAGFSFRTGKGDFILNDPFRIPAFLRNDLPAWRSAFDVQADPRLDLFAEGVRSVRVKARAELRKSGVALSWNAYIDGKVLEGVNVARLLRRAGQVVVAPELGLLRVDEEQANVINELGASIDPGADIPRYMLFSLFQKEQLPLQLTRELKQWRDLVANPPSLNGALPEFLRPYQKRGVAWMQHLALNDCHSLLADEMGLGKTVQVLSLLAQEIPFQRSSLIVCPASVVPVWKAEAARFFPNLPVRVLQNGQSWEEDKTPALWVASYTQLRRRRRLLPQIDFLYAVLDEAQFIKNPDAKVTQSCMAIRADRRLAVTGTPIENRELDLWTIFRFLMPGLLGARRRILELAAKDPDGLREQLRRQVAPFVLRRTKTDVASELPPKVEAVLNCPLTPLQEREYRKLAREGIQTFGEDIEGAIKERSMTFFALLTRLRQACCDPGLLPWQESNPRQSGKVLSLIEKLQEPVAQGRKAVIFSQFATFLRRVQVALKEAFPELPIQMLTGQTTNRAKPVADFQNTKGPSVILVSLKAGGTGITLNAADYVFLLDPWWNPAVEAQAIDRVHRIGQDKTVFVYRLIAPGTVEERVEMLKQEKRELFDATLGQVQDVSQLSHYFKSFSELLGELPSGAELRE